MPRIPHHQVLLKVRRVRNRESGNSAETPDYYVILLAGRYLRPKINGRIYTLCDVDRQVPGMIECGGRTHPVRVILKVYAKVSESASKRQRERDRYQRLLKGQLTYTE